MPLTKKWILAELKLKDKFTVLPFSLISGQKGSIPIFHRRRALKRDILTLNPSKNSQSGKKIFSQNHQTKISSILVIGGWGKSSKYSLSDSDYRKSNHFSLHGDHVYNISPNIKGKWSQVLFRTQFFWLRLSYLQGKPLRSFFFRCLTNHQKSSFTLAWS